MPLNHGPETWGEAEDRRRTEYIITGLPKDMGGLALGSDSIEMSTGGTIPVFRLGDAQLDLTDGFTKAEHIRRLANGPEQDFGLEA